MRPLPLHDEHARAAAYPAIPATPARPHARTFAHAVNTLALAGAEDVAAIRRGDAPLVLGTWTELARVLCMRAGWDTCVRRRAYGTQACLLADDRWMEITTGIRTSTACTH